MVIGIIIIIPLTFTGFYEWCTFININKGYVSVDTNSKLTKWIMENTEKQDVFLTPNWAQNRFFLAGRATFYGWPYYAWSAGHDTDGRLKEYEFLLKGADLNKDKFVEICKANNIKYIIDDPDMLTIKSEGSSEPIYNQRFIRENFELVAEIKEENTRVYKVF